MTIPHPARLIPHLLARVVLSMLVAPMVLIVLLTLLTATAAADSPIIDKINPAEVPNDFDVTMVLTGSSFQVVMSGSTVLTAPTISLEETVLALGEEVTSNKLSAIVPWGMEPGVYTVSVENTDGTSVLRPRGFTVTQALGTWATGGPYGGSVWEMAMDSSVSSTLYANLDAVGLFKSDDRGENWDNVFASYVTCFTLKPDDSRTIYLGGDDYSGITKLLRSINGGQDWQTIWQGRSEALGVTPAASNMLYFGTHDQRDHGGLGATITRTVDGGDTWEPAGGGLPPDASVDVLAVHPISPDIVYAGVLSGSVYKTIDGGDNWTATSADFGDTWWYDLTIDPNNPEHLLGSGWHGAEFFAVSTNGGATWQTEIIDTDPNDVTSASDIKFFTPISGAISLLTMDGIYTSTDAGVTWHHLEDSLQGWTHLLNPDTGEPAYIGHGGRAVLRSDNDGLDWEAVNNGLAGVQPTAISASPADPHYVYVASDDAGGFVSNNAGRSWRTADGGPDGAQGAAAHPFTPTIAFLGGRWEIYRTLDGGQSWNEYQLPGLSEKPGDVRINVVTFDPNDPQVLYAGAGTWDFSGTPPEEYGWLYRSLDTGENWSPLTVTLPISSITDIAIDPTNSDIVYLSTGRRWVDSTDFGSGIVKTTDGGLSWQRITTGITASNISSIAIDSDDPQTLYAGANQAGFTEDGGVYKTTDGGEHWQQVRQWLRVSGL